MNPRDAKRRLARELVALYHSAEAAQAEDDYFIETFSKKNQPVEAEEAQIPAEAIIDGEKVNLALLISSLELAKSNGDAKKLLQAGAVSLDGFKVTDFVVGIEDADGKVLKVGKHQFRKLTRS
jgi:tyrosyl-tRNA synthetase